MGVKQRRPYLPHDLASSPFSGPHLARARRHEVSTHSCDKIQTVEACQVRKMAIIYKMKDNLRRTPLTFISTNLWVGLSKEVVAAPF